MTSPGIADPMATHGTLPPDELTTLLAALESGRSWRATIQELELPTLSTKPDWFINPAKAAFYLSLGGNDRRTAMDIGAGSGVIAAELARHFDRVVALEQDPRWCQFMRHRFQQDAAAVDVVQGSALAIPDSAGALDLAVVNGVLEWVASSAEPAVARRSPLDVQLEFLRGIHARLAPGGKIGIAIENRYHYENFRGAMPHGEPPYAAIAPRPIAEWMTRRQRGESYRTWLYGARGYAKLLRSAGFTSVEIYAAQPTYHRPDVAIPLCESWRIRRTLRHDRGFKATVLDSLATFGMIGRFVHSFYIAAVRE